MKYNVPKNIEKHRVKSGPLATSKIDGFNGAFKLPGINKGHKIYVVSSNGGGWDHLSVTVSPDDRCPTWDEMKYVKETFFGDNQWAIQFMPPKSKNINIHDKCLHLWRPQTTPFPIPPVEMV